MRASIRCQNPRRGPGEARCGPAQRIFSGINASILFECLIRYLQSKSLSYSIIQTSDLRTDVEDLESHLSYIPSFMLHPGQMSILYIVASTVVSIIVKFKAN
jgi:hypothetical protein